MLKKLRVKFILINMTIVTAMLFVIFALVFHFTRSSLEQESIRMMKELADNPFQLGILNDDPEEVRLPYFVLQIGLGGEILATGGGYFDLSDEAFLQEVLNVAFYAQEDVGLLKDYDLRYYRQTGLMSQSIVFADVSSEQSTLEALLRLCLFLGGLSFLVFLFISFFFARWAVKPVERAWQQQKQFVADASHELKTPLTVILTNAELLQSPDYDAAQRSRFSESILVMSRQMRGLVEGLLELARADRGPDKAAGQVFDFSACMARAALPFEPLFFERGLMLESRIEPGLCLRGEEEKLRQLPEILLDNALKYAGSPGRVIFSLRRQGSHALLAVSNTGEPIPPAELKEIFKRFYRSDKARCRSGSYGLGLSIAESIVRAHGGKIWAESAGGWNRFFAQLPMG